MSKNRHGFQYGDYSALLTVALFAIGSAEVQAAASDVELEEIQVTGSRIQRSGFEAPTPTTIIGAAEIAARAAPRISQILFEIPAMRPTATATPFSASAGGTFANLRNLNPGGNVQTATRTLVLVDGRRIVGNTLTGLVDLNAIPSSLVERVEVVTGGASAAWGSDAVAGVTNFILRKRIDGFEGNIQSGQSERSDTKNETVSLAWGTNYAAGRGNVMIAGEFDHLHDVGKVGSRDWGNDQWGLPSGTLNGITVSRIVTKGVVTSGVTYGGVITSATGAPLPTTGPTSALSGIQFGAGGVPQPFTYGTLLSNNQMVGGSGADLSGLASVAAPVTRKNLYLRTTYDLSGSVKGFAEYSYANADSTVGTMPMMVPNGDKVLTIQRDNAYLPASVRATMVTNNLASFGLGRITPEFGIYSIGESGSDARRFAAGLDGKIGQGWVWDLSVGSGKTRYYDRIPNNIRNPNLRAAVDTVIGPNGSAICRVNSLVAADIAIVNAATYQGRSADPNCVPANPFGPGSLTPAVASYVLGTSFAMADIKQESAGGSIQGEPFSTWADSVSVAVGFDYRKDSVDQIADPSAQTTTSAFQTGLWQFSNRRPLVGSYKVKELFAETVVPLAKDLPFAKTLDLNAAVRGTDYSTSGSVTSWKTGLTYAPIDGLLFRGTRSKDIRAANLVELFTPGVSQVGAIVDYGRTGNPTASVPTTTIGNAALKPERADTTTFGVSWQPSGTGLRASVDYFQIKLKNAIGSIGGQSIVSACYGATPFTSANSSYCSLISRDSTGLITNVNNSTLNLAFTNTSGVDMELAYQLRQNWSLRLLATHLNSLEVNNGVVTIDRAGEIGNSRWRYTASTTYTNGPLTAYLQARYLSSALIDVTYMATDISDNNVPARTYLNGSVQYTIKDSANSNLQVFLNVNNLLDQDPPIVPSANTAAGQIPLAPDYDKIGRYFMAGLRFKF